MFCHLYLLLSLHLKVNTMVYGSITTLLSCIDIYTFIII
uniref:Uncharacterized protein n=1 Tax=Anguilla anguilla TaxID=7936 RepID=A0A0E9VP01_ANGAN